MCTVFLIICVIVNFKNLQADFTGNCKIDGVSSLNWIQSNYHLQGPLEISYQGVLLELKTKNIADMKAEEHKYLKATFKDNILKIQTTGEFQKFDKNVIKIRLNFNCTSGNELLIVSADVTHKQVFDPVMNVARYEYKLNMEVPKGFDFTYLLPIFATHKNAYTRNIYFESNCSEAFNIDQKGLLKPDFDNENAPAKFFTNFKTTKELKIPFEEVFTLVAKKPGIPERNVSAVVSVFIGSDITKNKRIPVFEKNLYFALYNINATLEMIDTVSLVYGVDENTKIEQIDFTQYFEVRLDKIISGTATIVITLIKSLSPDLTKHTDTLFVNILAKNLDVDVPGRTTLAITLPARESYQSIFKKSFYFAHYTFRNELLMEEPIFVSIKGVVVHLLNYTNYFHVSFSENLVNIKVNFRELPKELQQKGEIVLTIEGKHLESDSIAYTTVLIKVGPSTTIESYITLKRNSLPLIVVIIVAVICVLSIAMNICILIKYYYKK